MTEEELEQIAIKSAENMGPAQDAWVPGVGKIIENGEFTDLGKEYMATYGGLVSPNPKKFLNIQCVICNSLCDKEGHCYVCFPSEKE